MDTDAIDHITSDLGKLGVRDRYNGSDQIHTASETDINISHIGNSTIHTPSRTLDLNNIMHVLKEKKILSPFIVLLHIIMSFLNFILTFS